jgi:hypothetical protein
MFYLFTFGKTSESHMGIMFAELIAREGGQHDLRRRYLTDSIWSRGEGDGAFCPLDPTDTY